MQFANYGSSLKPPDLEDPPEGVFSAFFVERQILSKRQILKPVRGSRYSSHKLEVEEFVDIPVPQQVEEVVQVHWSNWLVWHGGRRLRMPQ